MIVFGLVKSSFGIQWRWTMSLSRVYIDLQLSSSKGRLRSCSQSPSSEANRFKMLQLLCQCGKELPAQSYRSERSNVTPSLTEERHLLDHSLSDTARPQRTPRDTRKHLRLRGLPIFSIFP